MWHEPSQLSQPSQPSQQCAGVPQVFLRNGVLSYDKTLKR